MRLIILILLIVSVFANYISKNGYTGLRYTLKKELVEENHVKYFGEAVAKTQGMTWPDVEEGFGSGVFSGKFKMSKISLPKVVYDFSKHTQYRMIIGDSKTIDVSQNGTVIEATMNFEYEFSLFGIPLFYGTGAIDLKSKSCATAEVYLSNGVEAVASFEWSSEMRLSGLDLYKGMSRFAMRIIDGVILVDYHKKIGKLYSEAIWSRLTHWANLEIKFYKDDSLNLLLTNNLVTMNESPQGYLTIGYQTDLSIFDRPYAKRIWRYVNTPVLTAGEKAKVCLSTSLIAHVLEMQGRGKMFLIPVDPISLGLTGKIQDLALVMPKIYEAFNTDERLYIGCRPISDSDVMRQTQDNFVDRIKVLIPINCAFGSLESAKELMSVNFYINGNITKSLSMSSNFFNISGAFSNPSIHYLKVISSEFPIENIDMIYTIISKIVRKTEHWPVMAPGLYVGVEVGAQSITWKPNVEEDCFDFT